MQNKDTDDDQTLTMARIIDTPAHMSTDWCVNESSLLMDIRCRLYICYIGKFSILKA